MKKLIIILALFFLTSCSAYKSKEAYCFSVVFENQEDNAKITLYCKTPKENSEENMTDISLSFYGNNFNDAFKNTNKGQYEVYFNSIKAYFFDKNLSGDDIRELSLILLDNSKYKTDNHIFLPKEKYYANDLHRRAEEICRSEIISRTNLKDYIPTLKGLKNMLENKK